MIETVDLTTCTYICDSLNDSISHILVLNIYVWSYG